LNLASRLFTAPEDERRAGLVEMFTTWENQATEAAPTNFEGFAKQLYQGNPVVFAAVQARSMLYSEVRFAYRKLGDKELFRTHLLGVLDRPWPNGTTGELLKRMEQDASLAGNAYIYKAGPTRLQRLRPDRVDVLSNRREVTGYVYWPSGRNQGPGVALLVDEVAHYTPIPDPLRNWVGMSWVQSAMSEVMADKRMTGHQDRFYRNAATPNLFVKVEKTLTDDSRERLKEELDRRYGGWQNAYKTIVLDGGADLKAVGADFQQSDFVNVMQANENRIALASGVPPAILGIKMGLDSGTFSNWDQQLKQFAFLLRDLWRESAAALSTLVTVPRGAELWWDESEVTALQDNAKNRAEIRQMQAATINTLIMAGYEPDSVVKAVDTGDYAALTHTGLLSVQMQKPGSEQNSVGQEPEEPFNDDED
jgi:HK97 family phage portal protein